jgi:hypothetical protein
LHASFHGMPSAFIIGGSSWNRGAMAAIAAKATGAEAP